MCILKKQSIASLLLIASLCFSISEGYAVESFNGELLYWTKNSFDIQEGTFEAWFKLTASSQDFSVKSNGRILTLFAVGNFPVRLDLKRPRKLGKWKGKKRKKYISSTTYALWLRLNADKMLRLGTGKQMQVKINWQKGEWHYIALTWKRKEKKQLQCEIFLDGVSVAKSLIPYVKFNQPKGVIKIGMAEVSEKTSRDEIKKEGLKRIFFDNGSFGTIDALRISNTVRTPAQIKTNFKNDFTRDKYTLLLDFFHNASSKKKAWKLSDLQATRLSENGKTKALTGQPGIIFGGHKIVRGRHNTSKAIQLNIPNMLRGK